MDFLATYLDYERDTTRYYLERCRELTPGQLNQTFDIGHSSALSTIAHIIGAIEVWTIAMRSTKLDGPPPRSTTLDEMLQRFDEVWDDFADVSRTVFAENRSDDTFIDFVFGQPNRKPLGGTILHVLTHITCHRWEIRHMLTRLGLTDLREDDVQEWEYIAGRNKFELISM